MRLTNWISNPGGEDAGHGWYSGNQIAGQIIKDPTFTARMVGARGATQIRWTSAGTAVAANTSVGLTAPGTAPVKPGQSVRVGVRAWADGPASVKVGLTYLDADMKGFSYPSGAASSPGWYDGGDLTFQHTAPARAAFVRLVVSFTATAAWPAENGKRLWLDNAYLYVGDTAAETPPLYFDGDDVSDGRFSYGWNGAAHASTSYRVDTLDLIHSWTRRWWEFLPNAYRADRYQNPEMGGYPMLRYMEGVGRIAGQVRDLTDAIWAGEFMNPATTPDNALSWLAQLMGTDENGRRMAAPELREYLVDMSAGGRVAVGTKLHIQAVAKNFLTNDRRVAIVPSSKKLHSLILVVAENDLPDLDGPAFIAKVRESGVVPAGHEIVVSLAVSTWDGWTAAAGKTWDELEGTVKTWAESDALGVVLE